MRHRGEGNSHTRMKIFSIVSFGLAMTACFPSDYGKFAGKKLTVKNCSEEEEKVFEPFEMETDFISFSKTNNSAWIRFQKGFRATTLSDNFYLQILDVKDFEEKWSKESKTKFPFDEKWLRGYLLLGESCPGGVYSLTAVDGFGRFDKFGDEKGDTVAGVLEFSLRDERSGEMAGVDFTAEFEFVIRAGKPFQDYSL